MTKKEFVQEWKEITKIKVFEIDVYNQFDSEEETLPFAIHLDEKKMTLWLHGIDELVEWDIDLYFTLDENLQTLHELLLNEIIDCKGYNLL